ncbi:MAG: VanW family protein, partial [Armatimonadetes bacterium]|nr:VanW family protein [Armatimonadota bacterium]
MRAEPLPTRWEALVFMGKVLALRAKRRIQNIGRPVPRHAQGDEAEFPLVLAESRTQLWSETEPEEQRLQLGKVHNLRLVARSIDRVVVPAGDVLSFWRQVGRPGSRKGFVPGRQIQEGCVVPAIAGGICQLSNALHDVALNAGLEVVERHSHTRSLPRSAWARGRDATVAWNYVDLRVRPAHETMVRVVLTAHELVVQLRGKATAPTARASLTPLSGPLPSAESCETCGMVDCFQRRSFENAPIEPRSAFLVDQVWPEYAAFVEQKAGPHDVLCLPVDGSRWKLGRYAWPTGGFPEVHQARAVVARRSWSSRRLAEQGAARQRANLGFDERLARNFARAVPFDVRHVVVQQGLLPFLWREGFWGGRTFDVLMVREPMWELQERLDGELVRCPERALLGDFRASPSLVQAERDALGAARRIVTPHEGIARAFGDRSLLLEWSLPARRGIKRGAKIAFPGPTVSRKGAYEVREVARRLGRTVAAAGIEIEGDGFWDGVAGVKP